uniref:C-type lectin domain-containing protein n=1 Tax=Hucho hucho TaxID=62062 RepID=A0A4W5N0H8_9TELE
MLSLTLTDLSGNGPTNRDTRDSSGSAQHSRRRVYRLVAVGFGLLCVLQVILNVSLRLVHNLNEGGDQLVCEKDVRKICPQDWIIQSGCSCYFISLATKNWTESRQDCVDRGADLVIINSREEQALIKGLGHQTWMGLTDREVEGTWRWVDGKPLTTSYWTGPGEPNGRAKENCAEIIGVHNDPILAWNDVPCDFERRWICERSGRVGCLECISN